MRGLWGLGKRYGEFALSTNRDAEPREAHRAGSGGVGDRRRDGGGGPQVLQNRGRPAREVQPGNGPGGRLFRANRRRGSSRPEEGNRSDGSEEKESFRGSWHRNPDAEADRRAGAHCRTNGQANDPAESTRSRARHHFQRIQQTHKELVTMIMKRTKDPDLIVDMGRTEARL